METQLNDELCEHMRKAKYALSFLVHRSIEKVKNGYIGFQITRGLWCKLRVFLLTKEGAIKKFEMIYWEWFSSEQRAKDKMREILILHQEK